MNYDFNEETPIYMQIEKILKTNILSSLYHPGQKLITVKEFSNRVSVNPNIVSRAISELQKTGLIYTNREGDIFVTEDLELIEEIKNDCALDETNRFISQLEKLNLKSNIIDKILINIKEKL